MIDLPKYAGIKIKELRKSRNITQEEDPDHTEVFRQRVVQLDKQLAKLSDLYMADMLTLADMQAKARGLQDERKSLIRKLEEEPGRNTRKEKAVRVLEEMAVSIREEPQERQKIIVNSLIEKVDVTAGEIKIRWKL